MVDVAETNDMNDDFHERKLFRLIATKKFDEAIKFLHNKHFTVTNKTAAVNHKNIRIMQSINTAEGSNGLFPA